MENTVKIKTTSMMKQKNKINNNNYSKNSRLNN